MDTAPKHLSTYEYWQLLKTRKAFIRKQLDAWEATSSLTGTGRPFDAIISPVNAHLPELHRVPQYLGYTGFCNRAYPWLLAVSAIRPDEWAS